MGNPGLYDFLIDLWEKLKYEGEADLAETVRTAAVQGSDLSTVFLGESRIALQKVLSSNTTVLTPDDAGNIENVIRRLNQALNHRS